MGELSKKTKGRIEQAVGGLTRQQASPERGPSGHERAGKVEGRSRTVKHAVKDAKACARRGVEVGETASPGFHSY